MRFLWSMSALCERHPETGEGLKKEVLWAWSSWVAIASPNGVSDGRGSGSVWVDGPKWLPMAPALVWCGKLGIPKDQPGLSGCCHRHSWDPIRFGREMDSAEVTKADFKRKPTNRTGQTQQEKAPHARETSRGLWLFATAHFMRTDGLPIRSQVPWAGQWKTEDIKLKGVPLCLQYWQFAAGWIPGKHPPRLLLGRPESLPQSRALRETGIRALAPESLCPIFCWESSPKPGTGPTGRLTRQFAEYAPCQPKTKCPFFLWKSTGHLRKLNRLRVLLFCGKRPLAEDGYSKWFATTTLPFFVSPGCV